MEISQIINTSIIPVILLPVTGLVSLVFYNRLAAVNQRIRLLQKELREMEIAHTTPRSKEIASTMKREIDRVHFRSKIISFALICLLSSLVLFSLCALFLAFSLFVPWSIKVALFFWFFGPLLICSGVLAGIIELWIGTETIQMQTLLLEKWRGEDGGS